MAQKHFDIIIKNVRQLLENKKWKANKLCEITGIPQPQMSKVLNGKSQFTFDQIIAVAEAFNVSIDYLVGRYELNESTSIPTNREIYEFISSLLENNILKIKDIDVEEECYVPYEGFEEYHYPYEHKIKNNKYKSFYFSNFISVLSREEFEKLDEDIKKEQYRLNNLYDNFTRKYGLINSRGNNSAFSNDSSYYLLCSLEILDEDGNLQRKADINPLDVRLINPYSYIILYNKIIVQSTLFNNLYVSLFFLLFH